MDCHTRTIVSGSRDIEYVALSYVWGSKISSPAHTIQRGTLGTVLAEVPRTIEDAILVTKLLGFRYIWVDMYCIDQEDAVDKHNQIAHMDILYSHADLTILVAAGDDCHYGIPGVGKTQRQVQKWVTLNSVNLYPFGCPVKYEIWNSKWWTRAWTFQEALLSHRRLVFTDSQMFFECNTTASMERVGGLEFVETQQELRLYEAIMDCKVFRGLLDAQDSNAIDGALDHNMFQKLVTMYSSKSLSFESDSLNAFGAIAMVFSKAGKTTWPPYEGHEPILSLSGIPCTLSSTRGQRELSLTNDLLWDHSPRKCRIRRSNFPSWTWAGYEGPARWGLHAVTINLIHFDAIEAEGGRKRDIMEIEAFQSSEKGSPGIPTTRCLHVTAPVAAPEFWKSSSIDGLSWKWEGPGDLMPTGTLRFYKTSREKANKQDCIVKLRSGAWSAICCGVHRAGIVFIVVVAKQEEGTCLGFCRVGILNLWFSKQYLKPGCTEFNGDPGKYLIEFTTNTQLMLV